jgi:WD40 repeat protein
LWDAKTGVERRKAIGLDGRALAVAIAPDGSWLATADDNEAVRLWDADTGVERRKPIGHSGKVRAVAIALDGLWLATADNETVRLWDAETADDKTVRSPTVTRAPDGQWLATAGDDDDDDDDETVRLWDAFTSAKRTQLAGDTGSVPEVAISSDGAWLATVSNDRRVRVWKADTKKCVAVMRADGDLWRCIWSPAGSYQLMVSGRAGLYRFEFTPPIA